MSSEITVLDGREKVLGFHMLAQYHALKLETKGLRFSRGSVYAHIKRTYGLKGSKKRVLEQFRALLIQKGILRD